MGCQVSQSAIVQNAHRAHKMQCQSYAPCICEDIPIDQIVCACQTSDDLEIDKRSQDSFSSCNPISYKGQVIPLPPGITDHRAHVTELNAFLKEVNINSMHLARRVTKRRRMWDKKMDRLNTESLCQDLIALQEAKRPLVTPSRFQDACFSI